MNYGTNNVEIGEMNIKDRFIDGEATLTPLEQKPEKDQNVASSSHGKNLLTSMILTLLLLVAILRLYSFQHPISASNIRFELEVSDDTRANLLTEAILIGKTYGNCEGKYIRSIDKVNGKNIWEGGKDKSHFIFWCLSANKWAITASTYKSDFLADDYDGGCGAYIFSRDGTDNWFDAGWSNNDGAKAEYIDTAVLAGETYANCQGSYTMSYEKVGGKNIWDGGIGNNRFIFYCAGASEWAVTSSKWRDHFLTDDYDGDCGAFINSVSDKSIINWYDADWTKNNGATAFLSARAELTGKTYANCQGIYTKSDIKVNGRHIWIGGENESRFIFWCSSMRKWAITDIQYVQGFIYDYDGNCGAFIYSANEASNWYEADWPNN